MQQADIARFAVVSGGSGGIGREIVRRLIVDGNRVLNLDRVAPDAEFEGETHLGCDLENQQQLFAAAAGMAQEFAPRVLVNNAAWALPEAFEDTGVETLERTLAVNVTAAHILARALVPPMANLGFGRIVNISSVAAQGKRLRTAYSASKAAIEGFTKTLALELGASGITVNAIRPGPIDTAAFRAANPPGSDARLRIEANLAVGRVGRPADIANAVSFFASEASSFVTGQVLSVCGGRSVGAGS